MTATITKGTIESLRIDLNSKCTFDLNKFLNISPQKFPPLFNMSFGQFDALTYNSGEFMVDCFYGCGNAAEPIVYEYMPGVHMQNWIEIMLESSTSIEEAYQAFDAWRDAMKKGEGEKWVWDKYRSEILHCNPKKYEAITHNFFKNVKISAITVGYNLSKAHCQ